MPKKREVTYLQSRDGLSSVLTGGNPGDNMDHAKHCKCMQTAVLQKMINCGRVLQQKMLIAVRIFVAWADMHCFSPARRSFI